VQIQRALNHILPELQGAYPFLKDDGIVGPRTQTAIQHFQERNLRIYDGRIDPGQKTLALMNRYLAKEPSAGNGNSANRVARAIACLRSASKTILSAETNLGAILPYADGGAPDSGPFAEAFQSRLALLDRHFKTSECQGNLSVVVMQLKRTYANMRSVIERSVPSNPNPDDFFDMYKGASAFLLDSTGSDSTAYTFRGGWQMNNVLSSDNRRKDRVYLCEVMDVMSDEGFEEVVIHELGHFVSIAVPAIVDVGYGWINDPRMRPLRMSQRVCNAQNYATFAIESRYGRRENRLGL
jgi:hypothetical protein